MKRLIAVHIFMLLCSAGQASHIMGGDFTYTLIGSVPQQQKKVYKISLNYYRNCDTSAAQFQPYYDLYICYDSSNANYKRAYAQISLDKISTQPIVPPILDTTCYYNNNWCVEKTYYEATVTLSEDTTWHLFLSDGARNVSINNLIQPDSTGIFFYTVIPAGISNSTPQFSNSPTPFICNLDTMQLSNLAFDSDGDSLVYKIVQPYGYIGGPVGLNTIATAVGEEAGTIEEVYEPFLIMEGFLMRTPRGREATEKAFKHLGKKSLKQKGTLFDSES